MSATDPPRRNGQARTARNPRAAGRPRAPRTPERKARLAARQAAYRAKYDARNRRILAYLNAEQVLWLGDYAKLHRLRGFAAAIRHLIERAMHGA